MEFRCWQHFLSILTALILTALVSAHGAPLFKIKHYSHSYFKPKGVSSPLRMERRLVGGSSPIHFINPFLSPKLDRYEDFFVPPPISMQVKPRSSIFKLPLQLLANGKPRVKGYPNKHKQAFDFLPEASSNIIKLPLKFVSNGKPVRVLIQDRRSPNHLWKKSMV